MKSPMKKITVKAIAERAGINRNTFYLHYNSVDDVLKEIQNKYSVEYSNLISKYNINKDTVMLVRTFFEYMESQDDFFIKITCDSRFDYIRERMQNKTLPSPMKITRYHQVEEEKKEESPADRKKSLQRQITSRA